MKKYDQHKMKRTQIREDQIKAGFFDGRFVSRTETPKNLYNRKLKHKCKHFND
jgi:stalled ribosome alternative rescue factor ArfA